VTTAIRHDIVIEIGGVSVRVRSDDSAFLHLLANRYIGFISAKQHVEFEFDVDLTAPGQIGADDNVHVRQRSGRWLLERGDFRAEWDSASKIGSIRQSSNPFSIDSILRIVHTLALSRQGGFLLHAASVVRNGRAFLFAGVSGAGKTTIASLAPESAVLLTDEISYVREQDGGYSAFGTPFTGELNRVGDNVSATVAALYLLVKGPKNQIEPVAHVEACRALLASLLFFAEDADLVRSVFHSACEFVTRVPVYRLMFLPDVRVWEMIA
jgi:hypothetical protein